MSFPKVQTEPQPERAVIAVGIEVAVVWATKGMSRDLHESGYRGADLFNHLPKAGIWLWEGQIKVVELGAAREPDIQYVGTYRALTSEEWLRVQSGFPPFRTEPDSPLGFLMHALAEKCADHYAMEVCLLRD